MAKLVHGFRLGFEDPQGIPNPPEPLELLLSVCPSVSRIELDGDKEHQTLIYMCYMSERRFAFQHLKLESQTRLRHLTARGIADCPYDTRQVLRQLINLESVTIALNQDWEHASHDPYNPSPNFQLRQLSLLYTCITPDVLTYFTSHSHHTLRSLHITYLEGTSLIDLSPFTSLTTLDLSITAPPSRANDLPLSPILPFKHLPIFLKSCETLQHLTFRVSSYPLVTFKALLQQLSFDEIFSHLPPTLISLDLYNVRYPLAVLKSLLEDERLPNLRRIHRASTRKEDGKEGQEEFERLCEESGVVMSSKKAVVVHNVV